VGVKQTAPQNVVLICHKVYAYMTADALIFAKNTNQRESLPERDSESDDQEED
jgi:hypothetical protein